MAFCDFVVEYNPEKDSRIELTKRILYSIYIKRLKAHKPAVTFVGGDSGEGKSLSVISLMSLLLEVQGIDIKEYFDIVNIYTPLQYPQKVDLLLHDTAYKKVNVLCIHEAREVVRAKNWQSFLTQGIADVNVMSRSIKRICTFIVSQFIRDITVDIRYTINYYIIVRRPKGKHARLYLNVLWKDDRDLDKPRLRKRKLSGYLIINGRYRRYVPQYLELNMPSKEYVAMFEKSDFEAKSSIVRNKLNRLINEMRLDLGKESDKVNSMVEWYTNNPDSLNMIGKRYKNKWRVKPEIKDIHDLTKREALVFEKQLNQKLKDKGIIQENIEV